MVFNRYNFFDYEILIHKERLKDGWKRYKWSIRDGDNLVNWGESWTLKGAKKIAKGVVLDILYRQAGKRMQHYE